MTLNLPRVRPGDLIKADFMNQILDTLDSLDSRIGSGSTNGVQITGLSPSGQVQVGSPLTIFGNNFEFSIGAVRVVFGGIQINTLLAGSNDSQLNITVPDLGPSLPSGGEPVSIIVSNRTSSDSRSITVVPLPQPLIGSVLVSAQPLDNPTNPIPQNGPTDFPFLLTSAANQSASFLVTPALSGPNWPNPVQALDKNKNALVNSTVPLDPNTPTLIYVRVAIPNNTLNTPFSLSVGVSSSGVTGNSGLTSYTVGQPPAPVDQTIDLSLTGANPASALSGSTIQLATGTSLILTYLAKFSVSGQYTISLSASSDAANWFFALSQPTPDSGSTTQATIQVQATPGSVQPIPISFGVRPQANASNSGTLQLTIQRKGASAARTQALSLQVKSS